MKVLVRRNDSNQLKIHIEPSDDNGDFVHPLQKGTGDLNKNLETLPP
jgi:hypothetical protein